MGRRAISCRRRRPRRPFATRKPKDYQARLPFPLKALQVDGGTSRWLSGFAQFETECQRRGIRLFELAPKSPELNGAVERAHRTRTEEFYQATECAWTVAELKRELLAWEQTYNTIRPWAT